MPSCTTPMLSKMPATVNRIQPDMAMMRMASVMVTVIAPMETSLMLHSQSARPATDTSSAPFSA